MIIYFIVNSVLSVLAMVLDSIGFLRIVTLPFDLDTSLIKAGAYLSHFLDVFWPLQPVMAALVWYYGIKFGLLVLRLVIGSRAPDAS